jgi:hypothetical protein
VEQEILENLGFSLDMARLATGMGTREAFCGTPAIPPEVEELEQMVRAVLACAEID